MNESLNDVAKQFVDADWNNPTVLPVLNLMWWGLEAAWEKMGLADKFRHDLKHIVLSLMGMDSLTTTEYISHLSPSLSRADLLSALKAAKTPEQAASILLGAMQDRLVSASSSARSKFATVG